MEKMLADQRCLTFGPNSNRIPNFSMEKASENPKNPVPIPIFLNQPLFFLRLPSTLVFGSIHFGGPRHGSTPVALHLPRSICEFFKQHKL